ncbi:MAG TPA: hypothetical protein EYG68_08325 [Leucothrix mucor]|nr:hypothetical protein [Leucothrix mucor]
MEWMQTLKCYYAIYIEPSLDGMSNGEATSSNPVFRTLNTGYESVLRDLQEAYDIAQRGGMLLFLTDYHLEFARLALTIHQIVFDKTAVAHIEAAKQLIEQAGYKRRLPEVAYLESLIPSRQS